MLLSRTAKFLLGLFFLADLVLISFGIIYRTNLNRDYAIYTNFQLNNPGITFGGIFTLEPPSFPTAEDALVDAVAYGSIATGRVQERPMRDRQTGELLGRATLVEVVTLNPDSLGQYRRIPLIVQFSPASDSSRNVMPWVLKKAVSLAKIPVTVSEGMLPREQVERIFSRGSAWNLIALLDIDANQAVLSQVVEYTSSAKRYYGGSNYQEPGIFTKILGRAWYPLVLDVAPLSEVSAQ